MSRPNILFVMTDQQTADLMSCTGTDWLHTPHLDRLAAEGTRFDHAVCANPVCVPSRTSMATGRMPGRLGAFENKSGMKIELEDSVAGDSLGLLMKRAGYETFYGGKVHMCRQLTPEQTAYDVVHENQRVTLADACIQFVTKKRDRPFFAVASYINPHDICYVHNAKMDRQPQLGWVTELYRQAVELPDEALPRLPDNFAIPDDEPAGMTQRSNTTAVTPSGSMSETYTERDWRLYRWVYARLIEQVDRQIGRILQALRTSGPNDDTVVMFTSDHGNMHGNHRLASKSVFYEESVRVPLILKHKGRIPAGRVDTTHLVSTGLDILPTCCDYAGVEAPEGLLGISQRAAAEDGADAPSHARVFSEGRDGRMMRDTRWKYTVYGGDGPREILTDLDADPGETGNLAASPGHAEKLAECREATRAWFEASGDTVGLSDFAVA